MFEGALPDHYSVEALKTFTAFDFERALAFNEARAVTNIIIAECWAGTVFLCAFVYLMTGYRPLIAMIAGAAYMLVRACWHGRESLDKVDRLQVWCELDVNGRGDACY